MVEGIFLPNSKTKQKWNFLEKYENVKTLNGGVSVFFKEKLLNYTFKR